MDAPSSNDELDWNTKHAHFNKKIVAGFSYFPDGCLAVK